MDDKFGSDSADSDGFDFVNIYLAFDGCVFEVVDSEVGDQDVSFLFFLVVIELEDGTAEENILSVLELFENGLVGPNI